MFEQQLEIKIREILLEIMGEAEKEEVAYISGVYETVSEAVEAARRAQLLYEECSLETRRKVIKAIRTKMRPYINKIAQDTYAETGMGRVADKKVKLELVLDKTPGVEDLITEAETGDNGMTLYELSPYGVIGAITPSTNPAETLICNTIGMLAAGNSVYFSVHPGAKVISQWTIAQLNQIIFECCGIEDLIVTVAEPSIEKAQEMMRHTDISMLVVTGGPGVVHQALTSGKKTIGAGAGNPPSIVDETANIEKAAADIVHGASFDNNILCIAEKSVIAVESISDFLIFNMEKNGAFLIKDQVDCQKLAAVAFDDKKRPSRLCIGKNAKEILDLAGISCEFDPSLIILRASKEDPFVMEEMLMPILPVVTVFDFDEALATALAVEQKLHHTATMHSQNIPRLNKAARVMRTSIFVKNGSSYDGLGVNGEGAATFTIATPTGEGTTTARHFARRRRCVLTDGFSIR